MDINALAKYTQRPALFARGEKLWDDPYIAQQMLKAHLDANTDAASRKPETIQRTVRWIIARLSLPLMSPVLDLGCGPGLYAEQLCRSGLQVTGVDLSANSIRYARRRASEEGLAIDYRVGNYLELADKDCYDAAMMIYYDLGVLSDADRDTLLANTWLALRKGGRFLFDVTTISTRPLRDSDPTWSIHPNGGFWRPGPHLVLSQTYYYPEAQTFVDQYLILENRQVSVYWNWEHFYSPETIRPVLERAGFVLEEIWSDLCGTPFTMDSPGLGVLARKI